MEELKTRLWNEIFSEIELDDIEKYDIRPICGGGGKGKTTQTVQKSEPWAGVQPYLLQTYRKIFGYDTPIYSSSASNKVPPWEINWGNFSGYKPTIIGYKHTPGLFDKPLKYYPGKQIAPFDPHELLAQKLTVERALIGSPEERAGKGLLADTLSGKYLNLETNPYINNLLDIATRQADTAATKLGAYGSSDWQALRAKTAGELLGNLYESERARQMVALGLTPQYTALDYRNLAALADVGELRRQLAQQQIEAEKHKWQWEQMEPWERLKLASSFLQPGIGGTTTTIQPYYTNPFGGLLGGALAGAGLSGSLAQAGMVGSGALLPFMIGGGLLGLLGSY